MSCRSKHYLLPVPVAISICTKHRPLLAPRYRRPGFAFCLRKTGGDLGFVFVDGGDGERWQVYRIGGVEFNTGTWWLIRN